MPENFPGQVFIAKQKLEEKGNNWKYTRLMGCYTNHSLLRTDILFWSFAFLISVHITQQEPIVALSCISYKTKKFLSVLI